MLIGKYSKQCYGRGERKRVRARKFIAQHMNQTECLVAKDSVSIGVQAGDWF